MKVLIKKLNDNAVIPTYGSPYAAGADLYACIENDEVIRPGETKLIKTGLAMEIPVGYAAFIYARSGLASKRGLAPANKVGVVDCDYRGEVMVALHNHSCTEQTVAKGEVIATVAEANGNEYKDGAHLHFEITKDGTVVDPATYLTLEEK